MTSTSQWTRVIVLTPPADLSQTAELGEPLRQVFAARDWFPILRDDPYLAMAELCLREKAQTARSAWGLQRIEQLALVVMKPDLWPELSELVSAVQRYLPVATIWAATDSDVVTLAESQGNPKQGINRQHVDRGVLKSAPPPSKIESTSSGAGQQPGKRSDDRSERVTRDEIDMLLRIDETEGSL